MERKVVFLILAILSALSLIAVGVSFAMANEKYLTVSFLVWVIVIGLGFFLKRNWK